MSFKRQLFGVFIRVHPEDDGMLELYTVRHDKIIIWGCVSADMLWDMKGKVRTEDLKNHEYELLIHFLGGKKFPVLEDV